MDPRSENNMKGVHPDLVKVMRLARNEVAFIVIEGRRDTKRQQQLVNSGASRTMNSRHLTGHAVDVMALVNGQGRWDWPLYKRIADVVKAVAEREGIAIVWGGDWRTFKDGPHFELDRKVYP